MGKRAFIELKDALVVTSVLMTLIIATILVAAGQEGIEETPESNLTGIWQLTLNDNETRSCNLTLYDIDSNILGFGYLTSNNSSQNVTAGGFIDNDMLNLYLVTEKANSMFRLNFTKEFDKISGNYYVYSKYGEKIKGEGTGSKTLDMKLPYRMKSIGAKPRHHDDD